MKLANGVNLHVINETKFKTIRIMVRFREEVLQENLAKRVLISNLWETTNAVYETGKAFNRRLSEIYGATFATGVAKKGKQHLLSINMSVVNPKFVGFDTLSAIVDFLKIALFQPDVQENAFNVDIFQREQTNLIHYLESMNEDRAYHASRELTKLFFSDKKLALPSVSTVELLARENAQSVWDYYQEMLRSNLIDIFVLGDVAETQVERLFTDFDFENRAEIDGLFYAQALQDDVHFLTEKKEAAQSILQLAYHLPVQYGSADYLALQIMNGLLGGFAHSKLFTNVREKASLAYSVSSTFDSFTGFFKISAGIDGKNVERAKALIFEQVNAMQAGDFSDSELEQTKTMLRNSYFMGQDSTSNNIELAFVKALLPERFLETDAFVSGISAVTKEDVQRVAKSLTLQAEYFMEGSL
ncbi:EF-P 5-aminopentanol modification-associated protein YfmF [Lactococcus nasutitermitis]|uniref:EF-P 5-aminopentanol modification-associated protein YfmF n=1 Tax=Lactococcus nasutitermitis TaxID=1652957 RepID=A0ABV9JBP8_9LACT|nr:pitrilysin family protein [Lactococcus nasutitermitis]